MFVQDLRKIIPYYDLRHTVRPGITGWAQVKFRYSASAEDAHMKLQYDLYYVKWLSFGARHESSRADDASDVGWGRGTVMASYSTEARDRA